MEKRRGNQEGSIYHDSDGRWRGVVDLGYRNGKRARKKFSGGTRREVAEKLAKALRDKQVGLPLAAEKETLASYLAHWLEQAAKPKVRYRTFVSYAQLIRVHIVPGLGRIPLGKLTAQHIDGFLKDRGAHGLSPRTVQYLHAVIRRALNQALRWDLIPRNVATLVQSPRVHPTEIKPFSVTEAHALLVAVKGDRWEAVYTVAIACGLRQGEILGLRWIDVDLENTEMQVRYQLQRNEARELTLVPLKTEKSRRTVRLPSVCIEALRRHHACQEQERLLAGSKWEDSGLVFTTRSGTAVDQRNLLKHYAIVVKTAGVRRLRFHDLRHTAASLLLAQRIPMKVVQATLGHADMRTTMNTYSHLYPEARQEVADVMDEILNPVAPGLAPGRVRERLQ